MKFQHYDPVKSKMVSSSRKPKLTWSDKRSGDSVGRGVKRGSYGAWTAYHSSPKKSFKSAKSTRSSASGTRRGSTSGVSRSSGSSSVQSDLEVLRKIAEIFKNSAAAESSTEDTSESTAAKGSEVLSPEVLRELRGETAPSDAIASSDDASPSEEASPCDETPSEPSAKPNTRTDRLLFDDTQPKNTDHCPHCGFVFPKIPKRGRACENCGQKFVVRSNCVLYNSIFLTPEESVANDYFTHLSYSIDHADKLAKGLLSEHPDLSPGELFMQMIEANGSRGHSIYDNTAEQESWLYQMVAEYEEKCGRKTSDLHKRAVAASKAKAKAYEKIDKMFDDISAGKIDIWK